MENDISSISNMIYSIARKFNSSKYSLDDLYQQGVIGAIYAEKNYDKNKDAKFSTYARMYIYGEIYKYVYQDRMIKPSKESVKLYKLISKTKELLTQELKKEPSISEISSYINIDEETIYQNLNLMKNSLSLDYEYDDNNLTSFISYDDNLDQIDISEILDELTNEEKELIIYRYFEGYSQSETGQLMNMSQSKVSRCEASGLNKMRTRIK